MTQNDDSQKKSLFNPKEGISGGSPFSIYIEFSHYSPFRFWIWCYILPLKASPKASSKSVAARQMDRRTLYAPMPIISISYFVNSFFCILYPVEWIERGAWRHIGPQGVQDLIEEIALALAFSIMLSTFYIHLGLIVQYL